jgi:general transcription factor 3C polypeptide 5 (transcription factor C subunit 1)
MTSYRQEAGDSLSSQDIARDTENGAPRYAIPRRDLTAVEIPAVVENIDRAVKAFGRVPSLRHVSVKLRLIY